MLIPGFKATSTLRKPSSGNGIESGKGGGEFNWAYEKVIWRRDQVPNATQRAAVWSCKHRPQHAVSNHEISTLEHLAKCSEREGKAHEWFRYLASKTRHFIRGQDERFQNEPYQRVCVSQCSTLGSPRIALILRDSAEM
jgi:hypothetical protein